MYASECSHEHHPELPHGPPASGSAGVYMSRMEPLPREVIAKDRRLRHRQGSDELGALRYRWCVELGMTYGTYAQAVGVTRNAIWLAVRGHAQRTGKPMRGHQPRTARTTPLCPDCGETKPGSVPPLQQSAHPPPNVLPSVRESPVQRGSRRPRPRNPSSRQGLANPMPQRHGD
jgi:hypothetical protein